MARQCFACSGAIRPAEGPSLLWDVESPQSREAFHLACWLAWRAEAAAERQPAAA